MRPNRVRNRRDSVNVVDGFTQESMQRPAFYHLSWAHHIYNLFDDQITHLMIKHQISVDVDGLFICNGDPGLNLIRMSPDLVGHS